MVWVSSPAGRVKLKARLYPGMMPHVVAVPFEYAHTHYGRWAAGRGENINHLVPQLPPSLAGTMALGAVKVKVTKA
jgi:anaerobic selenocysteine-containing dehydrogenase